MTYVVFGSTVSGRTLPIHGVGSIDGPTIATVPVRVTFQQYQTIHSLLEAVQQDALDTIPFEQMGLQDIRNVSDITPSM
jgi:hypothetical protein